MLYTLQETEEAASKTAAVVQLRRPRKRAAGHPRASAKPSGRAAISAGCSVAGALPATKLPPLACWSFAASEICGMRSAVHLECREDQSSKIACSLMEKHHVE